MRRRLSASILISAATLCAVLAVPGVVLADEPQPVTPASTAAAALITPETPSTPTAAATTQNIDPPASSVQTVETPAAATTSDAETSPAATTVAATSAATTAATVEAATTEAATTAEEPELATAASRPAGLSDGATFNLRSALGYGLTIEVQGGNTKSGGNVDVWTRNGTDSQRWVITFDSNGLAKITNTKSGLVMSAASASPKVGTSVVQTKDANKPYQRWVVETKGSQYVLRSAANTKLAVEVAGAATNAGADVRLWTVNGTTAQSWTIAKNYSTADVDALAAGNIGGKLLSAGTYVMGAGCSTNKALDVYSGAKASGSRVWQYNCNMTPAQRWTVTVDAKGYVTLKGVGSNKVLSVSGDMAYLDRDIVIANAGGAGSRWVVTKGVDNGLILRSSVDPEVVIDVASGSADSGATVHTWTSNKTAAQSWHFFNVSPERPASEGQTVENGIYRISVSGGMTVDVAGGSTADGTRVQGWDSNGTAAQSWEVTYNPSTKYYSIISSLSGKGLDMSDGSVMPGAPTSTWAAYNGVNQQWAILKDGSSSYKIVSVATGRQLRLSSKGGSLCSATAGNGSSFKFTEAVVSMSEGTYYVGSGLGHSLALDVAGGTFSYGGNVQSYAYNGSQAQKWYVRSAGKGIVTLQSANSGEYLVDRGSNVVQSWESGARRQWKVTYARGGGYTLVNVQTNKALEVAGAGTWSGCNVRTWASNGTNAQKWYFYNTSLYPGNGFYEIASVASGRRIDIAGASTSNGANAQLYGSNGGMAQRFWMRGVGNGWFTLTACCSNKDLDVSGGSTANGANVQQWTRNGSSAQRWKLVMKEYGLALQNSSGKVIECAGGGTSNGTNIRMWTANNTAAQGFWLVGAGAPSKIGYQTPSSFPKVSSNNVRLTQGQGTIFGYASPSAISFDASREDCINAFINRAYQYLGTQYIEPYSCAPGVAVDCSGLVLQCLYATGMDMGIYTPYNHRYQSWQVYNSMNWLYNGTFMSVSVNNMQRGDLVYFRGHVAIYLGGGQMIHSTNLAGFGNGVQISSVWYYPTSGIIGVQRPFPA